MKVLKPSFYGKLLHSETLAFFDLNVTILLRL